MGDPQATKPNCCRLVGLACDKCVRGTAGSIAALNEQVGDKALVRLFHSIYSDAACATMESQFRQGYREAVEERSEAREARVQIEMQAAPAAQRKTEDTSRRKTGFGLSVVPVAAIA